MAVNTKNYNIQLKRTQRYFDDDVIEAASLLFGEPLYMDKYDYLVLGPAEDAENPDSSLVANCKVIKAVNREATYNGTTYSVADKAAFYKNRDSANNVELMDENAETLYPITKIENVIDDGGMSIAGLLVDKVDVDENSVNHTTLGYDSGGVYVDEDEYSYDDVPESLREILKNKVSTDDGTPNEWRPLALGMGLDGIAYVDINDGVHTESNFIKNYIDSSLRGKLSEMQYAITLLQQKISTAGLYIGNSAPSGTDYTLWLDTTSVSGGLKYYSDNGWQHVPVAYS